MPLETGSTSVSVIAVARIASTALPPAASICKPACAASGWVVATTLAARTGFRGHAYGLLQENGVMVRSLDRRFEIEHHAADDAAGLEILERAACLLGGTRLDRRGANPALLRK